MWEHAPSFCVHANVRTWVQVREAGPMQFCFHRACNPPIAYTSRSLKQAKRNYGITELETLTVVWAVIHFQAYLYGNRVRIYTDHSEPLVGAVKSDTSSASENISELLSTVSENPERMLDCSTGTYVYSVRRSTVFHRSKASPS